MEERFPGGVSTACPWGRKPFVETMGEAHRVALDVLHADPEQVVERRAQHVNRFEGQGRVFELSGVVVQPVLELAQVLGHVEMPVAIRRHQIEEFLPDVERGHAVPGEQPLVGPGGEEVDAGLPHVQIEHADPLDRVGVEVGAPVVGEFGEGREVLAVAVLVRDPRHGDEPGALVDLLRERLDRRGAGAGRHHAHLDPPGFGEVLW